MTEDDPTSPTSPVAPYPPLPNLEAKSRALEFYGFVAWMSTSIVFVIYVLWALVPDRYIIGAGIDWYPSREWAILFPAWSVVLVLSVYWVYFALALYKSPSISSMSTMVDSKANFHPFVSTDGSRLEELQFYDSMTMGSQNPEPYDLPIGIIANLSAVIRQFNDKAASVVDQLSWCRNGSNLVTPVLVNVCALNLRNDLSQQLR